MIDTLVSWLVGPALTGPFVLVVIAVVALVATRITRLVVHGAIRRLARRSLRAPGLPGGPTGLWRTRLRRVDSITDEVSETRELVEQRRRQRIDAATRMVNHLVTVVVWIVAAIVAFHVLEVDPAFFLSSAGFLGAGLAIGGQHKVNDYLTGLSVHFEDRYGVGDDIVVHVGWDEPVSGAVDHVGLFSTRVRDGRSALHFPNSALASVRNLSQEAAAATLRLRVPDEADAGDAVEALRGLAGSDGLTDLIFVGDLAGRDTATGEVEVAVQTATALDDRRRDQLIDRAERVLDVEARR